MAIFCILLRLKQLLICKKESYPYYCYSILFISTEDRNDL